MIDSSRRTILTTGAAAAAATTAPRVFAQTPQAAVPQGLPAGAKVADPMGREDEFFDLKSKIQVW